MARGDKSLGEVRAMTGTARPAWAVRLQAMREERGWNKPRMARELQRAAGRDGEPTRSLERQILAWEKGQNFPRDWVDAYAAAFGLERQALFGTSVTVDETRRHLLACLGVLGVERAVHTDALATIRGALSTAIGVDHTAEEWEEIAYEYGCSFLSTPPAKLLPELAAELVSLHQAIRATSKERTRRALYGPAGKLSALVALTSSGMGASRDARDWWQTARHAADASGDADLRAWVRGYEAMSALYWQRPLPVVLRRAEEALAIGGPSTTAVLEALAVRAQALAVQGRGTEAKEALRVLEARHATLPQSDANDRLSTRAWPETALRHTQAYVYAYTGDSTRAEQAQDAALRLYPSTMPRQRAQIELLRATTLVRQGRLGEGVHHAAATLERLDPHQRTHAVIRGAHIVAESIPGSALNQSPVQNYREHLAALQSSTAQNRTLL